MVTIGSLFTGYGGLTMATERFFGGRTVWTSDIDPGACRIIAHRFPDVPNLGDITKIDWTTVEPIDVLDGGWPCQPFSHAGKRLGAADERALWPWVVGAVRLLRPRYVFLENVAAIASAGELARATADLSALGYVGQWRCLRAADVGAPHGRARVFILATHSGRCGDRAGSAEVLQGWQPQLDRRAFADALGGGRDGRTGQLGSRRRDEPANGGNGAAPNPPGDGRREGRPEPARLLRGPDAAQRGHAATDAANGRQPQFADRADWLELGQARADGEGLSEWIGTRAGPRDSAGRDTPRVTWGAYEPAIRRWERTLGRPAPAPTEASPRGTQRLSPAFVEWMMGLPDGWVTDVPGLGRNQQLKAIGNGVVPQQAQAAVRLMLNQRAAA